MNSPTNPLVPGKSGIGHEKQHGQRCKPGHGVGHTAVVGDHPAVQAVVQHTDAQEQCAGDKTVRNHLHHGAFDTQCRTPAALRVLKYAQMR